MEILVIDIQLCISLDVSSTCSFLGAFKGDWEIKEYSYISLGCAMWQEIGNGSLFMSPVETRGKHRVMSDVTDFVGGFFSHARGFVLLLRCYMAVLYGLADALCTHVSLHFNRIKFQLRPGYCECIDSFANEAARTNCRQRDSVELLVQKKKFPRVKSTSLFKS